MRRGPKAGRRYQACRWDDVATRPGGPWWPYCSERCARAEAKERERARFGPEPARAALDWPEGHPEGQPLVPYEPEAELELWVNPWPAPDELDEWEESFLRRAHRERTYAPIHKRRT